jgi:predicted MPP superfamily phosphohydrolase
MDDPQHVTENKYTSALGDLKVYNYTVAHEDAPDGLSILHISDLHLDRNNPEQLKKLQSIAENMGNVDFILMT